MNCQRLYVWSDISNWENKTEIELPDEKIQQISLGQKHVIMRTQSKLFGFGQNLNGQLGNDDCKKGINQLNLRFITNKIKQISCGWNHTLLLDQFGNVFSAGEGKNGALGYGRGSDSFSFKQISNIKNINYISAGRDHSLALSSIKVYGWGNSMDGQLGIPKQKIWYEPQQLFIYPSKICYAGAKYSLFITQKGIYGTGQNQEGQLGLGNKIKVKIPKKISQFQQQIIWVGGSSKYSIYKNIQNNYYISGTGCFGQYLYPTKIKYLNHCNGMVLSQQYGIVKNSQNVIELWDSSKQKLEVDNKLFNKILKPTFYSGPKILLCLSQKANKFQEQSKQVSLKINQSHRNKGLIARSSIQYNYNQQLNQNNTKMHMQQIEKDRKTRKKSQNKINSYKFDLSDCRLSQIDNNPIEQSNIKYGLQEYSRFSNQYHEPKQTKKYISQQIFSPHFKKQSVNQSQNQFNDFQIDGSDRITQLRKQKQVESRILQMRQMPKNLSNKLNSASGSLLAYSQDTNPLFNTNNLSNNTKSKQHSCKAQQIGYSNDFDDDIRQRMYYLQKQNIKKDECIRKMRRQLMELMQIVQSDSCMRQILEQKNKSYLPKRKQQLEKITEEQQDIFTINAEKLRNLLGKTVNSLNFNL